MRYEVRARSGTVDSGSKETLALLVCMLMLLLLPAGCAARASRTASVMAAPRAAIHYPRRSLDLSIRGDGSPMIRADGTLDLARCDSAARYDIVIADADPLVARPDIAAAIVKRNPQVILLAYLAGAVWDNPHPGLGDTTTSLWRLRYRLVRDMGALLYNQRGDLWSYADNVDRSNHRAMLALADLDARAAAVPGVAGLFLDTLCPTIWSWVQSPSDSIAYRSAGYVCGPDWDHAYQEGHRLYVERLRERVGAKLLVGNCGPSGPRDVLNGWTRENFPNQNGGSWATNMLAFNGDPGYLQDCELYRQPSLMGMSAPYTGVEWYDRQRFLFGFASATLGDGTFAMIGRDHRLAQFDWPPEYDIDLGTPLSKAFRSGSSTWRREFSRGYVEVDVVAQTGRLVPR